MATNQSAKRWTTRLFSVKRASLLLAAMLLGVMVIVLSLLSWHFVRANLLSSRQEMLQYFSEALRYRANLLLVPAENRLKLLSHTNLPRARTLEERLQSIHIMRDLFDEDPSMSAFYIAYPDGDIMLFRPLFSRLARLHFGAPAGAVMMVQSFENGHGEYFYFDNTGQLLLHTQNQTTIQQDMLAHNWYRQVENSAQGVISVPYIQTETRSLGITLSYRNPSGVALGVDLNLRSLGNVLDRMRVTKGSRIALTTVSGKLLAYSEPARILMRDIGQDGVLVDIATLGEDSLSKAYAYKEGDEHWVSTQDGQRWWVDSLTISALNSNTNFLLLAAIPEHEALHEARSVIRLLIGMGLIILLISLGSVLLFMNGFIGSLRRLTDDTRVLTGFDFSPRQAPHYRIREVQALSQSLDNMREIIDCFLKTSVIFDAEKDLQTLLHTLLQSLMDAAHCEGGAVYLTHTNNEFGNEDGSSSEAILLYCHKSLDVKRFSANSYPYPEKIALTQDDATHPVLQAAQSLSTVQGEVLDCWLIATPLCTQERTLMGVLTLRVSERRLKLLAQALPGFVETLANHLTVAIEMRRMLVEQKKLLFSMARLVGGLTDEGSTDSGMHKRRISSIATALAEAAHNTQHGALSGFKITEADREALFLSSCLYDCGKITTPSHIVDKGSKLEMPYNRIHEIRMRFELLKSDALVSILLDIVGEEKIKWALDEVKELHDQLDEEFSFVAQCNLGSKDLCNDDIRRLETIAARRWLRTLDDRLGLSPAECEQLAQVAPTDFPVWEKLLDDKPWHRVEPDDRRFRLETNHAWDFATQPPRWLANNGELYNLCTLRGTLNQEDRYIINQHIIKTMSMLEAMPFPPHLGHVLEIVGAHYERMDGKGYPRGLRGEQMSVLARVLVIADIFEALTSPDLTNQKDYDLQRVLREMQAMVDDGRIDGDLFRIFVDSGVAQSYAKWDA